MERRVTRVLVAALVVALIVPVAWAQIPSAGRPLRLEGYWDRNEDVPEVLGTVDLSAGADRRRTFGITALRAYQPAEEGPHVLRRSGLRPALLLRGPEPLLERMFAVLPSEKIVAMGLYAAGPGTFVLSSVEVQRPDAD